MKKLDEWEAEARDWQQKSEEKREPFLHCTYEDMTRILTLISIVRKQNQKLIEAGLEPIIEEKK